MKIHTGNTNSEIYIYQNNNESSILMIVNKYTKKRGLVAGSFLFFYGTIRFVIENFRQPDSHLGFIFSDFLTMGQLLCIPMILIGLIFIVTFKNKNEIIS